MFKVSLVVHILLFKVGLVVHISLFKVGLVVPLFKIGHTVPQQTEVQTMAVQYMHTDLTLTLGAQYGETHADKSDHCSVYISNNHMTDNNRVSIPSAPGTNLTKYNKPITEVDLSC